MGIGLLVPQRLGTSVNFYGKLVVPTQWILTNKETPSYNFIQNNCKL